MGICYLKNRRSGFSYMSSSETVNQATQTYDSNFGILSKTGSDARSMFTDKVVRIYRSYPFFFQPIQDGSTNPRVELAFREPAKKITKNQKYVDKSSALDSSIDWRNTADNSYDGMKLKLLVHDEAGKWVKPNSISKNWGVTQTCLLVGRKFRDIFFDSNSDDLDLNGMTSSGLHSLFIPAFDNLEGFIDEYGYSVIETPVKPVMGIDGEPIEIGSKEYLQNRRDAFKNDTAKLSEFKRQFPFTVEEAFRNDSQSCIFDVEKIYQQIDYNSIYDNLTVRGEFVWKNGVQDSEVIWLPYKKGKWEASWLPPEGVKCAQGVKNGKKTPSNQIKLVAGCDPYDHDTTTDGRRSNGSAHVYHKFTMDAGPTNQFVCEYVNRPPKAEIFYEDMIKMCIFYGCQILVENNKIGIIKYFERRGYNEYLMDRPESTHTNSSRTQKLKGIPSTGAAVINAHAEALATYIYDYVGINSETGEIGQCYFNGLLEDWSKFDIEKRTKFDASISSGIALMGAQKVIKEKKEVKTQQQFVRTYNNKGNISKNIN